MSDHKKQRKILLDLAVTLDGFIEGKHGEIDWCIMEPDMKFTDFLNRIDTILYGRKSYDLWGQYIPDTYASADEKEIWDLILGMEKIVFSKTQTGTNQEVKFISDNILEEIDALKRKPGKDIWLYGGASLITTLLNLGVVDEFRLSVHPVILGEGKPLFAEIKQRLNLKLIESKTYPSGVVQLIYGLEE